MGFFITRSGFTQVSTAMVSVANDMLANGFTQVYPTASATTFTDPNATESQGGQFTQFSMVLAATAAVDTLVSAQPWSVNISVGTVQSASLFVGTPLQIQATGAVSGIAPGPNATVIDYAGATGAQCNNQFPLTNTISTGFFNRGTRITPATQGSYPVSYALTITSRGFALAMWEEATDDIAAQQSWMVVQRAVDRVTGAALTSGKAPLFCVNATNDNFWQFTVREADINRPTIRLPADSSGADYTAVVNSGQQISIDEAGKYIINFPCRLNTQRYAYTQELDMIGYTSANVVSQFAAVPVTVYGESSARTYTSLFANGSNDSDMRILFLSSGGGI